jgi:hypothetical protein
MVGDLLLRFPSPHNRFDVTPVGSGRVNARAPEYPERPVAIGRFKANQITQLVKWQHAAGGQIRDRPERKLIIGRDLALGHPTTIRELRFIRMARSGWRQGAIVADRGLVRRFSLNSHSYRKAHLTSKWKEVSNGLDDLFMVLDQCLPSGTV